MARLVFLVPQEAAAEWGAPAQLDVGEIELLLEHLDQRVFPLLRAAQAALLALDADDVDRDGRLGVGAVRFEPWVLTVEGADLAVLVSSPHGPTGWVPDDPDSLAAVRAALTAQVHSTFAGAVTRQAP